MQLDAEQMLNCLPMGRMNLISSSSGTINNCDPQLQRLAEVIFSLLQIRLIGLF
jgi:hypothetical protein